MKNLAITKVKAIVPPSKNSIKKEKGLGSSTKRKQLFLTLTNVNQNDSSLTLEGLYVKLRTLDPRIKVVLSRESHSCGISYHYHGLLIFSDGIRKNTYRKEFDSLFPRFSSSNTIQCEGCKSKKFSIVYIIKGVDPKVYVNYLRGYPYDNSMFYTNLTLAEFGRICKGEKAFYDHYKIISSMKNYSRLESWSRSSLSNNSYYLNHMSHSSVLWDESRHHVNSPDLLSTLISKIDSISVASQGALSVESNRIVEEYGLTEAHVNAIDHILYLLLVRGGWRSSPVKLKMPVIVGFPNVGKTSLINKFKEAFDPKLFFSCGFRIGDFTGIDSSMSPILVFDDVFMGFEDSNYSTKSTMYYMKVLSKELSFSDNKYQKVSPINYSGAIVLTNIKGLFNGYSPLRARVCEYRFNSPVDWTGMPVSDFKSLLMGRLISHRMYCTSFKE